MRLTTLSLWFCAPLFASAQAPDPDGDGDGLSDFHERHKYFTDPAAVDSDRDGLPDGDWAERREYAYTVRSIVQVAPPVTTDVLCDDYQDARILERAGEYVELEVIHYPLNTVASALTADPDWRRTAAALEAWTRPGLTANWDAELRAQLVAALRADGIDPDALDDKALVERASAWLLRHAKSHDGFSTFCSAFVDGVARIHPGLEESARQGVAEKGWSVEEQWQRELFAKGMFQAGVRGTCTSSAIYLNGCLRALGIPTRIVLAIPLVDSSDPNELAQLERLRHGEVRALVRDAIVPLGQGWSSHTFNEVFVGGRWRRLNYDRLGQNILDPNYFGLMTHVATFSDWADGNMAATWGLRQAQRAHTADAFGGGNPYSALYVDDRFGAHAEIVVAPAPEEFTQLTIDALLWFHERPAGIDMELDDPETAGHLLLRVVEGRPGAGAGQYRRFYEQADKKFQLFAAGQRTLLATAARGYWARPEDGWQHFYLRLEPGEFAHMAYDVPYTLQPCNGRFSRLAAQHECHWAVHEGVTITRRRAAAEAEAGTPAELTIRRVFWSDAVDSPTGPIGQEPVLLLEVGASADFPAHKQFTAGVDRRFFLEAAGYPTLQTMCDVGGVTTAACSYITLPLGGADWDELVPGATYTLRPQNGVPGYRWRLAEPIAVRR